jgi:hypothetical protein
MAVWEDFLKNLGIATDTVSRVRLGQGVVGKTTLAVLFVLAVLGIVAWRLTDTWPLLAIGLAAVLVFVLYLKRTMDFADRNPAAALLEGAEFLKWQQTELAAKNMLIPPRSDAIIDPDNPALPPHDE